MTKDKECWHGLWRGGFIKRYSARRLVNKAKELKVLTRISHLEIGS